MKRILYVYVDESGDFGLSDRSSRYFLMCALVTDCQKDILRIMKHVRKGVLGASLKKIPELKWSKASPEVRVAVLKGLATQKGEMWYVCLCKTERTKKEPIYNNVARHLIRFVGELKARKIMIVIDRTLPRRHLDALTAQLMKEIDEVRNESGIISVETIIKHSTGQEETCLQAVDYVCGAVFAKYERDDPSYFKLIESRIARTELID